MMARAKRNKFFPRGNRELSFHVKSRTRKGNSVARAIVRIESIYET